MKFPPLAILENEHVRLEQLAETHRDDLRRACNADPDIWEIYPYPMHDPYFDGYWQLAKGWTDSGQRQIYAVLNKGQTVGTSSYYHFPDVPDGRVSIGGTYYAPHVRGTKLNPAAKLLLLDNAFAAGFEAVQFHVDLRNKRSQAAVLKLGVKQTRIIEKHMTTWTGHLRDTVEFEIEQSDWQDVREKLRARLSD
jgi:N-acetyltransferase